MRSSLVKDISMSKYNKIIFYEKKYEEILNKLTFFFIYFQTLFHVKNMSVIKHLPTKTTLVASI